MDVYLSGISGIKNQLIKGEIRADEVFALESFYSMQKWEIPFLSSFSKFMLDSGAFTFMYSPKHESVNWEEYADAYADFVKEHDIKLFFELDIDSIVGLGKVEQLRHRIEQRAGRKSIPVWHKNRGKDYFVQMCKEYDYVAIGGLVKSGGNDVHERYFPWFINTAHKYGAKIHGLGYTNTAKLSRYRFDSVDSTTWTNAGRFGELHRFTGSSIEVIRSIELGQKVRRLRSPKEAAVFNFNEWMKFQRYASKCL